MKKILICGDSFAADWTPKYKGVMGWPNLLAKECHVVNLAQAGCSEYKVYRQLESVDLDTFTHVIVSHASPFRLVVKEHPVHSNDVLHSNADLMYADIKEHSKKDKYLLPIVDYFERYFDRDSSIFTHNLICEKIDQLTSQSTATVINMVNSEWDNLYQFQDMIDCGKLFIKHRGLINHYTDEGNDIIFNIIRKELT